MAALKHALAARNACVATSASKRITASARGALLPPCWRRLAHDDTSFLSVVANDILSVLAPLLPRHAKVRDPAALCHEREVMQMFGDSVRTLCFDHEDHIVVPMFDKDEVRVYDTRGALVREVGVAGDHSAPFACVTDARGRMYVSEYRIDCVGVFGPGGSMECSIGAGAIGGASGLDLSRDGAVLFVAAYRTGSVECYCTATGATLGTIGAGRILNATGVAVLSSGDIAVSTFTYAFEVRVFHADGTLVRSIGEGLTSYSCQFALDQDDNIYVAGHGVYKVIVFSSGDGRVIGRFGAPGGADDQTYNSLGVAISSDGAVVCSTIEKQIHLYK